jgi:SagB-type dehydrogenase family enzyme
MRRGSDRFRVHPLLLIHPAPVDGSRALTAEKSSSLPPLILREPLVWFAISLLPAEFTEEEARRAWGSTSELSDMGEELWQVLTGEDLVTTVDATDDVIVSHDAWAAHGWREAAIYHEATRDFPFVPLDQPEGFQYDASLMSEFAAAEDPPPVALRLDGEARVRLPRLHGEDSAESVLEGLAEADRRGTPGLALLLDICSGERERRHLGPLGEALFKAVPSGGARHPTEVFIVMFEGAPETPGLYHYDVAGHELVQLRTGEQRDAWDTAAHGLFDTLQPVQPFALVILATMWERAMWRYRDARSWRAPVMDVGHVVGAYRTVLTRLGLAHVVSRQFEDHAVSTLLGTERLQLTPMSMIAFG